MIPGLGAGMALPVDAGGPFDLVNGLPAHPLVVHAAVVLVPLSAVGLIVMVFWRRFSRHHGWLVMAAAGAAFLASFVAKESGEALALRVGGPGFDHASLGDRMPAFALALLGVTVALWLIDRRAPIPRRPVRWVIGAVAVVVAVANLVWVYLVGDSGAQSVWSDVVAVSAGAGYLPFR